jgi:hypothetical protein
MRITISGHRGANPPAQRTADNRTISAADLVTDRGPGSTTNPASDSRIQGGIVSIRLNSHQCKCQCNIFNVHEYYEAFAVRGMFSIGAHYRKWSETVHSPIAATAYAASETFIETVGMHGPLADPRGSGISHRPGFSVLGNGRFWPIFPVQGLRTSGTFARLAGIAGTVQYPTARTTARLRLGGNRPGQFVEETGKSWNQSERRGTLVMSPVCSWSNASRQPPRIIFNLFDGVLLWPSDNAIKNRGKTLGDSGLAQLPSVRFAQFADGWIGHDIGVHGTQTLYFDLFADFKRVLVIQLTK